VNSYPVYKDFEALDRRSRIPESMLVGDAIGSMITATVFGLTRAVDEIDSGTGSRTACESSNGDSILGASACR
jgi:hypothetical protein